MKLRAVSTLEVNLLVDELFSSELTRISWIIVADHSGSADPNLSMSVSELPGRSRSGARRSAEHPLQSARRLPAARA